MAWRKFVAEWLLAAVCLLYLGLTLIYSLWTPAWEANDEADHVANVEYFLEHRELIPLRHEFWHETHQPPLYYVLGAGWQRIIGVPIFLPVEATNEDRLLVTGPTLLYRHDYTPAKREAAVSLHKLRLFSIVLGLGTVLLTYCAGLLSTGQKAIALSSAAFVAVLPKFNVISSVVTNDSLLVLLCSLGLVLALLIRTVPDDEGVTRNVLAFALGLTAGAAIITKLNSLPVFCCLLASLLFMAPATGFSRFRLVGLAGAGLLATSGWWLFLNYSREGTLLGQTAAFDWLRETVPGLIEEVPWTDGERFLKFVPSQLFQSIWYIGGWGQFVLPFEMNLMLSLLAGVAGFAIVRKYVFGGIKIERFNADILLLIGCCLAGLASVLIIAHTTTQAEGRVAYGGLSAFAVLATIGLVESFGSSAGKRTKSAAPPSPEVRHNLSLFTWPALLLAVNIYAIVRFVIPFAGL